MSKRVSLPEARAIALAQLEKAKKRREENKQPIRIQDGDVVVTSVGQIYLIRGWTANTQYAIRLQQGDRIPLWHLINIQPDGQPLKLLGDVGRVVLTQGEAKAEES